MAGKTTKLEDVVNITILAKSLKVPQNFSLAEKATKTKRGG